MKIDKINKSIRRETTSIRINPELWHKAKIHALENHMSVGELIEYLIKKALKIS